TAMKLDRIVSLPPSLAAACLAFVGLASVGGCVIPDDYCDRHPEDRNCPYVIDTYRHHGGMTGSNSGKGGCSGNGAGSTGVSGHGGTGTATRGSGDAGHGPGGSIGPGGSVG